ncbi:CBASS cGAMP-activated phospholipase [Aureimonas endophytica]|nr:CBASS cGAMP-activated phospholipase [Aureimonas endophytica]
MMSAPSRRSNGTTHRTRERQPSPEGRPFKILSIDGGGIRGILPAAILAQCEDRFLEGRSIGPHFDMIAGTSTGGIIALGLGKGMTANGILNFYLDRGDQVFPPPAGPVDRMLGKVRRFVLSKHDRRNLEGELRRVFDDTLFGEATARLIVPAFEGVHGEPYIFKTPHHPDYKRDGKEKMVAVACAMSAAPTFLGTFDLNGYVVIDGGIWTNNPVMNALVDALTCFQIERSDIQILSIGCGQARYSITRRQRHGGLFDWRGALEVASRAPSMDALGQAGLLIGRQNLIRLDAPESDDLIPMDDFARAGVELPGMARTIIDGAGDGVRRMFLST